MALYKKFITDNNYAPLGEGQKKIPNLIKKL